MKSWLTLQVSNRRIDTQTSSNPVLPVANFPSALIIVLFIGGACAWSIGLGHVYTFAFGFLLVLLYVMFVRIFQQTMVPRPRICGFVCAAGAGCALALVFTSVASDMTARTLGHSFVSDTGLILLTIITTLFTIQLFRRKRAGQSSKNVRVVILGVNRRSALLTRRLRDELPRGIHIVGAYCAPGEQRGVTHSGIIVRGGTTELARDAEAGRFELIVATCDDAPTFSLPGRKTLFLNRWEPFELFRLRLLSAGRRRNLEQFSKCIFDRLAAVLLLILLAPAFALIALAIRFDSEGPLFFRQVRHGLHGEPFRMWKFRTMHHHFQDLGAREQTQPGDRRVTRVGRLLRRTSMDELPQLINVVMGDMSLVGPRPHALDTRANDRCLNEVVPAYPLRHAMKPGITGLAQVSGYRGAIRSEAHLSGRVAHDLFYIETWSFWLDVKILCTTLIRGFSGRNVF